MRRLLLGARILHSDLPGFASWATGAICYKVSHARNFSKFSPQRRTDEQIYRGALHSPAGPRVLCYPKPISAAWRALLTGVSTAPVEQLAIDPSAMLYCKDSSSFSILPLQLMSVNTSNLSGKWAAIERIVFVKQRTVGRSRIVALERSAINTALSVQWNCRDALLSICLEIALP